MGEFTDFDAMFADSENSGEAKTEQAPEQKATPSQQSQAVQTTQSTSQNAEPQVVMNEVQPVKPQQKGISPVSDDFEIGFSKDMENSLETLGIEVADIGKKVSKVPIERYRASASKVDRISFLTKRVIPIKYHYFDGAGSVICFHGKCCDIGGMPQVRYLFPIAVYQTDAEGNLSGSKVELKILSAGEDLYKSIITLNNGTKQFGGIDHADALVTCTDERYQKISVTYAGPAVWRKYTRIAEFLKDRWMHDGDKAYMAIARKVDEQTFDKLMNLDEEAPQSSFDAAANTDLSQFFN